MPSVARARVSDSTSVFPVFQLPSAQSGAALVRACSSGQSNRAEVGRDGKRYRLTQRQERFALLFAQGVMSLVDAYRAAGYASGGQSSKTARENASRLLNQPKIRRRVSEHRHKVLAMESEERERVRRYVVAGLKSFADADVPARQRIRALELLGRIDTVQMFVD